MTILYEGKKKHRTSNDTKPPIESHWKEADTQPVPVWKKDTAYAVGFYVKYVSNTYNCILAHTSAVGLEPDVSPTLWALV